MAKDRDERGRRAGFDRATGEVKGSGAGAGGGNPGEDYDADPKAGAGTDPVQAPRREQAAPPEEAAQHDSADPVEARHG